MERPFKIELKKSVLKDIRKIPVGYLAAIRERILQLAVDPVPNGAEPIQGYKHHYRIRIGNYRVIYEVASDIRIVTIIRIGNRKDVYRQL